MDDPEHLERFFRVAAEREVGVIAMKVVERGSLIQRGLKMERLLPYVLSHPVSTAIIGITGIAELEENVRIARAFEPLSEAEMAAIEAEAQSSAG
jgi:predicted aldo/keto reductase-like oxidoreductase